MPTQNTGAETPSRVRIGLGCVSRNALHFEGPLKSLGCETYFNLRGFFYSGPGMGRIARYEEWMAMRWESTRGREVARLRHFHALPNN